MIAAAPERVLLTGGHEFGGVASFAESLSCGFEELGIPSEIIPPSQILSRWRDLRDWRVLKILSTTAALAVPLSRRAISIVHGVPYVPEQGWLKLAGFLASYKLTNANRNARLVSVSDYSSVHMHAFFNIRIDGVIRNPVKSIYLEPTAELNEERCYVTYVGRLIAVKNVHRIVPAVRDLLNENPGLRACIIGDGPLRPHLQESVGHDPRFEFPVSPGDEEVRAYLRRSRVFVSGHSTEGFGITYAEALSQGCVVAMPASGGGVEIALAEVGGRVQLLPISLDRREVLAVLRRALRVSRPPMPMDSYTTRHVAAAYLEIDRQLLAGQRNSLHPEPVSARVE
jgi:glycosyltransferase involved in cell wall biosynthesis